MEGNNESIERLKATVEMQAKQIEMFKTELESLRRSFVRVSQFPKLQLVLLKKYNGITSSKNLICFIVFRGYYFGLITNKLAETFKGRTEAKVEVGFEGLDENIEVEGKITKLKCGITLLELNANTIPKKLQEHCLIVNEVEISKQKEAGTKIVAYAPGLEIVTGYILSNQLLPDGELKCQLHLEEYYMGALVFDEHLLPIGISSELKSVGQAQGKTSRIEVSSMFPLTIKIPPAPVCKVIGIGAISNELDLLMQARVKEEAKKVQVLEDGTLSYSLHRTTKREEEAGYSFYEEEREDEHVY